MDFFISRALAEAPAQTPTAQEGGIEFLIMMAVFFAIMYFLIIRPQAKRAKEHKTLLDGLNKGDEVVTTGGILGKITELEDAFITLQIGEGLHIQVQRNAIGALMPKGTLKKR